MAAPEPPASANCCGEDACCGSDGPAPLGRRNFVTLSALAAAGAALPAGLAAAPAAADPASGTTPPVPEDKGLSPDWLRSLRERGTPTVHRGAEQFAHLGMPIGGLCCGQLYLGGDGRLWHWDIFNRFGASNINDRHFTDPMPVESPFRQGFVVRTTTAGRTADRTLDSDGFTDIAFTGRYPMARVDYRDDTAPVDVTLEACTPYTPLEFDDSARPVTVLSYTLRNTTGAPVTAEIGGWAENPVCLDTRTTREVRLHAADLHGAARGLEFSATAADGTPLPELPDHGTFALAAVPADGLDLAARPSIADWSTTAAVLDSPDAPADAGTDRGQAGAVTATTTLEPGAARTITFLIAWHFPVPDRDSLSFLTDSDTLLRHYAARFDAARDVATDTAAQLPRLLANTREWTRTWYDDSTLPHWLLERVMAGADCLATATAMRFTSGRFYGWEGTYCCPGTCEHVWNYAQAAARLFPELERDTRERVDLGIAMKDATGEIGNRAEADTGWAADGQCGTLLRIHREHLMSADPGWLQRVWPEVRRALQWTMDQDAFRGAAPNGVLEGPQPNTLDATWYGEIAWITGVYLAALRSGEAMATAAGDTAFAARCGSLAARGTAWIAEHLWNGEYFVQLTDADHPDAVNTNIGCSIDQLLGQSWAHQVGLTERIFPEAQTRTALDNLWRYNFCPKPVDYRAASPIEGGRTYYDADTPALLMCTWPHGGADKAGGTWSVGYFNEAMNGFEYQVASHMIAEGLVEKGLAVTRAVHDRYRAERRNPYNEIECSDHYARSMASYGVHLALCGYDYDGPAGRLALAPRIQQDDFAAAFTAAEGWGRYRQQRHGGGQRSEIELRYGRLRLRTLELAAPDGAGHPAAALDGHRLDARSERLDGGRIRLTFAREAVLTAGQRLTVRIGR